MEISYTYHLGFIFSFFVVMKIDINKQDRVKIR